MSIIPLSKENFEVFTIKGTPTRAFSSGSGQTNNITGSINPFGNPNLIEKSTTKFFNNPNIPYDENTFSTIVENIQKILSSLDPNGKQILSANISSHVSKYIQAVKDARNSIRNTKKINIQLLKYYPDDEFNQDNAFRGIITGSVRNAHVKNLLMPHYRTENSHGHYSYTNYHALNFFTASNVPSSTGLLYPNYSTSSLTIGGVPHVSGCYVPPGEFTFEFYINPKYAPEHKTIGADRVQYNPGTLLHLPQVYSISLISGSSVDKNGIVDGFRLQLQCSQSADIFPDQFTYDPASSEPNRPTNIVKPRDLVFATNDNSLKRNHWHHVAIRWPGTSDMSGSFIIDGKPSGEFLIASSSIAPTIESLPAGAEQSSVLCVGNFISASVGDTTSNSDNHLSKFFSGKVYSEEGLLKMNSDNSVTEPAEYEMKFPLNAEIHDLKIYNKFKEINELYSSSLNGITDLKDVLFYVPPFFVKESPRRSNVMLSLHETNGLTNRFVSQQSGITDNLTDVNFINNNLGYAVGYANVSDDIILKTTDGGQTWTELNSGGSQLNSVVFYNEDLGYIAGENGTVKYSTDGGQTWQNPSVAPGGFDYAVIAAPTATAVYIVASDSVNTAYKSTDAGDTWSSMSIIGGVNYLCIDFVDEDATTGYVGSTGGLIAKTTNSGTTWTRVDGPLNAGTANQNDLHVHDATTVWIVNEDGEIHHTTNSGTTWTKQYTAPGPLNSVHFINDTVGFVVGDAGIILGTTDAGTTWSKLKGSTTENLNGVYAVDQRTVYAVGDSGTIIKTTSDTLTSLTTPVNPFLMAGAAGHDISVENYCRDFATGRYPRLLHLTSSVVPRSWLDDGNNIISANARMFLTGSMIKRNMTIVPCDNGLFRPNFELLRSGSVDYVKTGSMTNFIDDLDSLNLSMITLKNILSSAADDPTKCSALGTLEQIQGQPLIDTDNFLNYLDGPFPRMQHNFTVGKTLSLYQLTNNPDFTGTTIFDASNIFYGQAINKKTITINTNNYGYLSGTQFGFTVKDNGYGNIYRASAKTKHAEWNSIGTVFYNEGIIAFLSPHTVFFGDNNFSMTFKGEHNVHVLKINAIAGSGMLNSSSNPSYVLTSASLDVNDSDKKFVYITGINFHDENLNVVAKTQLAQPVIKRTQDSYLFKSKIDF